MQFQYWQVKHPIPQLWNDNIKNFAENLSNLSIQDHHLIKCRRIFNLEKINSRKLFKIHCHHRRCPPEVLLGKGDLKINSTFTGENPRRSVISIKLQSNFNMKFNKEYIAQGFPQLGVWEERSPMRPNFVDSPSFTNSPTQSPSMGTPHILKYIPHSICVNNHPHHRVALPAP